MFPWTLIQPSPSVLSFSRINTRLNYSRDAVVATCATGGKHVNVCSPTRKGLQNKALAARVVWNASTSLSLTGCLCFKALSSSHAAPPPSPSLPPSVLVPIPQIAQRPRSVLQTSPAYRDGSARLLSHSRIALSCVALGALRS